jgi:hypothetical protein
LGHGDPDAAAIAERFRAICAAPVPDDGVIFDIPGLEAPHLRRGRVRRSYRPNDRYDRGRAATDPG